MRRRVELATQYVEGMNYRPARAALLWQRALDVRLTFSVLRAHSPEADFSVIETSNRTKDCYRRHCRMEFVMLVLFPKSRAPAFPTGVPSFRLAAHSETGVIP